MKCLFCEIIKNNIKSYTIYEDDIVKCFLDVNPKADGHLLIVPKQHFLDIDDIDEKTIIHIFKTSQKLKKEITHKLNCDGIVFMQNNGSAQEIKHFHLHLIPEYLPKQSLKPIEEIYQTLK